MNKNETYIVGLGNQVKNISRLISDFYYLVPKNIVQFLKISLKVYNKFKIDTTFKLFFNIYDNSGDAVKAILDWYKIDINQLFIVVDLPLGK